MNDTPVLPARPRTVLFLTAPAPADLPAAAREPACTLPLGAATFVERILESCARAGLRELDLVVSEAPESVRSLVGDGWRWGLSLRWHLAKEADVPYGVLGTLAIAPGQRVVIGHGHLWLDAHEVRELVLADGIALQAGADLEWTGWASFDGLFLAALSPHADYAMVRELVTALHGCRGRLVATDAFASAANARELMRSQELALADPAGRFVPDTWVRMPWGAMSPDAYVHPQAALRSPVSVGPGCMVAAGAEVGPGVVLSRDVLVAKGASLRDTLVLPDTHIAGPLRVRHSVVQGYSVHSLRWNARTTLPRRDALLMPLRTSSARRISWGARTIAALLAAATAVPVAALAVAQRLLGAPMGWRLSEAVLGWEPDRGGLHTCTVRQAAADRLAARLIGHWGGLLDVAQGRRQWFGVRPRNRAQWFALSNDWRQLFDGQPIGLIHAAAWAERGRPTDGEAQAVADAYFSVKRRRTNTREVPL